MWHNEIRIDMSKKLDATIRARVPKPLKRRLDAIAKKESDESGTQVTASDVARKALHRFATEKEAA